MSETRNSPSAPSQRALVRARQKAERLRKEIGVCEATVRREIQRVLDGRKCDAPERYFALQKARLDWAMQAVDSALGDLDLRGVPALVQLLAEYDRYEGFSARLSGRAATEDLPNSAPKRLISAESKTEIGAPVGGGRHAGMGLILSSRNSGGSPSPVCGRRWPKAG